MAKRRKRGFTPAERYAILVTHGDRCYLGGEPIDMLTFQVDHVIPEELLDDPPRLVEVLEQLGRKSDFDVNSFENWLPACAPCNNRKRADVFEPSPMVQLALQRASGGADAAREASARTVRTQELAKATNTLMRSASDGPLSAEVKRTLRPLLSTLR